MLKDAHTLSRLWDGQTGKGSDGEIEENRQWGFIV